jgi:PTS system cellobiose-specific IIC component
MSKNISFLDSLQEKVMSFSGKMQSNIYIQSITQGMMGSMGVLIGGSIFSIIVNLPVPGWTDILVSLGLYDVLTIVVKLFQLTAPIMCFNMGYALAKFKGVNQLQSGIISFMSFILTVPLLTTETGNEVIALSSLNAQNVATAMITGLVATSIFAWVTNKNIVIKMPDTVPEFVSESLGSIPAAFLTVIPFVVLRGVLAGTDFGSFPGLINALIAIPLQSLGNNLGGHMTFLFFSSLLWWFGIHNMPVMMVAYVIMTPPMTENINAIMSGLAAPNALSWLSFMVPASFVGGPGSMIGLAVCTALFAKSKRFKTQGKIQLIPTAFNITEPIMFGMPTILNPLFLLPSIIVPQLVLLGMYAGMSLGLFTTPVVVLSTFLPGPIVGFLMGGGIGLGIYLILATLLSIVCYYPFLIIADKNELALEKELEAAQESN